MSFAKKLYHITASSQDVRKEKKEAKKKAFLKKKQARYDELMHFLTKKYAKSTYDSLVQAAQKGYAEKYINFHRDDFKANFPGLGNPSQVQRSWLNEMMDPKSKYLINDDGNPEFLLGLGPVLLFDGIYYDVWNNGSFTTYFSWGEKTRNKYVVNNKRFEKRNYYSDCSGGYNWLNGPDPDGSWN
jgi:hypothetical protein